MTWENILKSDTINYDDLDKKEVENRVMEIVKGRGKLSTMYYDMMMFLMRMPQKERL